MPWLKSATASGPWGLDLLEPGSAPHPGDLTHPRFRRVFLTSGASAGRMKYAYSLAREQPPRLINPRLPSIFMDVVRTRAIAAFPEAERGE
jgi:hypothetical protein